MTKQRRVTDDFVTFLESMQRREVGQQAPGRDPTKLLSLLAESGPQPVSELMAASGLGAMEFLGAPQDAARRGAGEPRRRVGQGDGRPDP